MLVLGFGVRACDVGPSVFFGLRLFIFIHRIVTLEVKKGAAFIPLKPPFRLLYYTIAILLDLVLNYRCLERTDIGIVPLT